VNQRNGFTAAATIYPEIFRIGCNHQVSRVQLTHANQAQVRQIGLPIPICGIEPAREELDVFGVSGILQLLPDDPVLG
jgi:hypothetical protein